MTLPSFISEQSLYRSSRRYRSSAIASVASGVRPSDDLLLGSYQQSGFNCTYYVSRSPFGLFDDLSCSCYDEAGNVQQTDLQYAIFCQGDIYNANGVLGCDLATFG